MKKKDVLKLKTVWVEATINNNCLFQYTTIGEGLSNKYWFLPLGVDNICIVKEGVCFFQMFLRDYEEKDADNFWLISHYDDMFKPTPTPYMPRTTFGAIISNNPKGIYIRKNGK